MKTIHFGILMLVSFLTGCGIASNNTQDFTASTQVRVPAVATPSHPIPTRTNATRHETVIATTIVTLTSTTEIITAVHVISEPTPRPGPTPVIIYPTPI